MPIIVRLACTVTGAARLIGFLVMTSMFVPVNAVRALWPGADPYRVNLIFYKILLRVLGFTVRVKGRPASGAPVLFVANHSSYLDIPVLGAVIPASFVAKAEVARWPFIGYIAKIQNTAFVERRSVRAAEQRDSLSERLKNGHNLILFPEGTSSDGQRTLPFKTSLFGIVENHNNGAPPVTVQPVSVLCTELGGLPLGRAHRADYAWFGAMTLAPHLWKVFKYGRFTIDVIFHQAVSIKDFPNRKALALYCRGRIVCGVEACVTGRLNDPKTEKQLACRAVDLAQTPSL